MLTVNSSWQDDAGSLENYSGILVGFNNKRQLLHREMRGWIMEI